MADRVGSDPKPFYPFMTTIPGRNVLMKVHKTIGQAKNAIQGVYRIQDTACLYEWDGDPDLPYGGWKLLYEVEPNTPSDQMPWMEQKLKTYRLEQSREQSRTVTIKARNVAEARANYARGEGVYSEWSEPLVDSYEPLREVRLH